MARRSTPQAYQGTVKGSFRGHDLARGYVVCRLSEWPALVRGRPELARWSTERLGRSHVIALSPPSPATLRVLAAGLAICGRRPGGGAVDRRPSFN